MWSVFGADVSVLATHNELQLRRAGILDVRRRFRGPAQRVLFDAFDVTAAEGLPSAVTELDLRRGDRVTIYVGDRLCELECHRATDGIRDEELLPFAMASKARRDAAFVPSENQCVADRIDGGKSIALALLARSRFAAFDAMVRDAGARIVSMQPWCAAVVSQWLTLRTTMTADRRWAMILEPDVGTVAHAQGGSLRNLSRLPISEAEDRGAWIRRVLIACEAEPADVDLWIRGEAPPGIECDTIDWPRSCSGSFLDVLRKVTNVP